MTEGAGGLPPLRVRDTFPPVSTEAWLAVVRRDLGAEADEARLVWRTDEGLTVKPFFRREDLPPASPGPHDPRRPGWRIVDRPSWRADAIRGDRVHEAGGTAVHELAWVLAEAVDRIAASQDDRSAAAEAATIDVVLAVGSTYFTEIAKLRALRRLWAGALRAFGAHTPPALAPCVHARTAHANKSALDPSANLLRVTTEAMSAVIGGADVVLVEAYGFAPHLAVNVQYLLAEEAHLAATADPAAGAYYVEWLTDGLAAAAWTLFQQIEAAGGQAVAERSGLLATQLAEPRAARQRDVATRRRTLVGVNAYPAAEPPPPSSSAPPAPADGSGLAPLRLAAPYERLRARTARHGAATGHVPHVHLLTRGDPVGRTARAAFARSLFGCAGFAITEGADVAERCDLLVLCGADEDYPGMMRALTTTAATAPIIVAGRPRALMDALVASGVQDFVYAGMDAVALLDAWQDRLGLVP